MRIITGSAKGTVLYTLAGNDTRPTSEKAKEAVFSMLQFEIEGRRVLDLFAGSGQMALEAVSRGASGAVLVDKSRDAIGIIEKNVAKTHFTEKCCVFTCDYADYLKRQKDVFDLIFIDPPYDLRLVAPSLELLRKGNFLKPTSVLVCESREEDIFDGYEPLREWFEILRKTKYGIAHVTVLKPKNTEL